MEIMEIFFRNFDIVKALDKKICQELFFSAAFLVVDYYYI